MDNEAVELEALENIMSDARAEPMKLSYGLLRSITDNFSNEIGRGGFGVVYQGVLENGDVAVKKLMNLHALTEKQFLEEITCLKKSKHKNIVRFLGYCSETQGELSEFNGANVLAEEQQKLLCFEYVPNGDIRHYLQQEKSHGDDWPLRYRMIRGICQGLHYLHGEQINHLDLKPENVMLDAQMEPKITDFGLSRFLDQDKSKIITQHILGTFGYIAPETIDRGEISSKSDIYALGIIIIELLTGNNKIDLDNWEESLDDIDCPQVRRCIEIARSCTDHDRHNRPTIVEVISDLDELETMIPPSSLNQVAPTTTSPQVDVYPHELSFPFVPNQEMHCELSLTNKTNGLVVISIKPEYPERYHWREKRSPNFFLEAARTKSFKLCREAVEELPPYTEKLEVHFVITDKRNSKELSDASTFAVIQRMGFQLHVVELTAVFVSKEDDQALVVDTSLEKVGFCTTDWEKSDLRRIVSMDVHPTETWVLIVGWRSYNGADHMAYVARKSIYDEYGTVYIWNWETNEKMGEYIIPDGHFVYGTVARIIARKQWVVMGNKDGSILVRICPTMHHVKEFKAHRDGVTALAVHPTRPFLLSSSNPVSLKLWDWNRDWSCIRIFEIDTPVRQIMFNPKHATAFASVHENGIVMEWRIGQTGPITRSTPFNPENKNGRLFTYIGDRHFSAAIHGSTLTIRSQLGKEIVHTFFPEEEIIDAICHPTRPILVTVSFGGCIRLWDPINFRLKRTYVNRRKDNLFIGFTGSRRLVIGSKYGITVMDVDLE